MLNRSVCIALCLYVSGCLSFYTTCKDGWIPFRGSCYLFHFEEMPFPQAEQFCRIHENSHLVHVDGGTENQFLKDRMGMVHDHYWWMGLTDETTEGVWEWLDTGEEATFTDFKPGDGGSHNSEDCAAFEGHAGPTGYQWIDSTCSEARSVLCETRGNECGATVVG